MDYRDTLPKEVLAVLPSDPSDQLELAHRISNLAFSAKVAALEQENVTLRHTLQQRTQQMKGMQGRVAALELEANEATEKARHAVEEQSKLLGEKNALIATVKKLNRDLAKLDNFKRNLLQSLQDEEDTKDYGTALSLDSAGDRLVHNVLSSVPASPPPSHSLRASYPAAGGGVPSAAMMEGSPRVDGKEFFRQARARLAYEQFSAFLQNIKELNAHRQTREETLRKAADIFGTDNGDLYASFESLLSRHLPL